MSSQLPPLSQPETIIRSAYSLKDRVQISFTGSGRTKQSFKTESDINHIMARFLKTGVIDFTQKHEPRYGVTTGIEYQACMLNVAAAKSMFADLPAELRNRFENEPAKFLDFVQDERNRDEATALGLLKRVVATPPEGEVLPGAEVAAQTFLRAPDGTFREQTRKEKAADAAATKAAKPAEPPAKDQFTT